MPLFVWPPPLPTPDWLGPYSCTQRRLRLAGPKAPASWPLQRPGHPSPPERRGAARGSRGRSQPRSPSGLPGRPPRKCSPPETRRGRARRFPVRPPGLYPRENLQALRQALLARPARERSPAASLASPRPTIMCVARASACPWSCFPSSLLDEAVARDSRLPELPYQYSSARARTDSPSSAFSASGEISLARRHGDPTEGAPGFGPVRRVSLLALRRSPCASINSPGSRRGYASSKRMVEIVKRMIFDLDT